MAKDGSENAWIQELNTLSSSIEHKVLAMAPAQASIRKRSINHVYRRQGN